MVIFYGGDEAIPMKKFVSKRNILMCGPRIGDGKNQIQKVYVSGEPLHRR